VFGLVAAPVWAASPTPQPFADLAARLLPAVVNISTSQMVKADGKPANAPDSSPYDQFFKDFFDHDAGKSHKSVSLGSGFIIDKGGYVVTNNHVIEGADEITVILQDDTNLKATLVGTDTRADLALLKVSTDHDLPSVAFGDSDRERVGDWVMAVGNPFGLGGTVTSGILSARAREINPTSGPYDDFLQTDAPINRGNSGGPLFNMDGEVIGINSAIFSPSGGSIGIGFAIPSAVASHIIGQIREFGHVRRGYLGARIQTVDPEVASDLGLDGPSGVLIAGLVPDGPAARAGIQPGDVLLTVAGTKIDTVKRLERVVSDAAVDQDVAVTLSRAHDLKTVSVKIGEAQAEPTQVAALPKPGDKPVSGAAVSALGLTLSPATPELKSKYQLDENAQVVVTAVAEGGPAADKDLKPGDVVVEVAQEEVKGLADVTRKIDEAREAGHKSVLMLIDRSGDLRFVAVRLDRG
jgi:serine protease Do